MQAQELSIGKLFSIDVYKKRLTMRKNMPQLTPGHEAIIPFFLVRRAHALNFNCERLKRWMTC